MDYYNVLDIDKNATQDEIKRAYRQKSMKYHPDRNKTPEAQGEMEKINAAYEILSDDTKRRFYDMEKSLGFGNQMFSAGSATEMPINMNDVMNSLFSMGSMGGINNMTGSFGINIGEPEIHVFTGQMGNFFDKLQKPPTIKKQVHISFDESYYGVKKSIEIDRWSIVNKEKVHETTTLELFIQQGIQNHESLLLEKQGNRVNDRIIGDVEILILIEDHDTFTRNNLDLIIEKSISLKEALCGFKIEIEHINKKTYLLNNETNKMVVFPGMQKVINNLGFQRNNQVGNMIIVFSVIFPESLSQENIEKLKNIL